MIQIENVSKHFGDLAAVDSLDLTIPDGQFFGFLGPNGAGKTTTIKMITGLLRPDTGRVTLNGIDIQKEPEAAKRYIGYIPDIPFFYEKLTGMEFLQFVGRIYEMDEQRVQDQIDEYVQLFHLESYIYQRMEQYSHGTNQKIVFAAAFLHEPQILVIDEPMVGLDPQSARLLKDTLRTKVSKGATIFMSTHTLPVVEELCNRVGIIRQGQLIADGAISELRSAETQDATLEEIFLKLTYEESDTAAVRD